MKLLKVSLLLVIFFGFYSCNKPESEVSIIPKPEKISLMDESFKLDLGSPIIFSDKQVENEAQILASILGKGFGGRFKIKTGKAEEGVLLKIEPDLSETLGHEGYKMSITRKKIEIEGANPTGVFYGIQSLRQLLPVDFEYSKGKYDVVKIPGVEIIDYPRFKWRGFMLDESRHFKGMVVVKDILDQLALLKMNTFHWHLTDDQGWRIEIKKYPKLTEIGAFRKDTQSKKGSDERSGEPHGGFYTQEEIKEIIDYAKRRHIKIIPEIEMPGHASAAIASYPWLGVLGTTKEVPVVFGKLDDSYNVTDQRVYTFLEDVLSEVFELFPERIVHIGGDEVMFDTWKKSEKIQAFIKKEGLSSPADLQIYFTNKISNFIDENEHRMMGWNEILGVNVHEWNDDSELQVEQELAKSAIIHFWKGDVELMKKAVSKGYDVVNSLHSETYLDYNYKRLPLDRSYSFDPIPEDLDSTYHSKILGLGCQMWSEWIPSVDKMENQIFPRLAAYAEVGWTSKQRKSFSSFKRSLEKMKRRWKLDGVNYYDNN